MDTTNRYSVKEIQEEMLFLLKEFHRICIEHDIHYSVHAGTMIGMIRDHGFIEWDDDVDLSFTRAEYEKWKKVISTAALDSRFRFIEKENAFPQLWMQREGKPAVWADFFIYDYITESKIGQKIKIARIAMLLGILKTKQTMYLTKKRGLYKGWRYALIYCGYLFGKTMSAEKKFAHAEKVRQSMAGKKTLIHRSNDRFIGIGFVYPKEVMSQYLLLPFEDTQLMVTKNYDDILIPSYGDYMTPARPEGGEADVHEFSRTTMPSS